MGEAAFDSWTSEVTHGLATYVTILLAFAAFWLVDKLFLR